MSKVCGRCGQPHRESTADRCIDALQRALSAARDRTCVARMEVARLRRELDESTTGTPMRQCLTFPAPHQHPSQ